MLPLELACVRLIVRRPVPAPTACGACNSSAGHPRPTDSALRSASGTSSILGAEPAFRNVHPLVQLSDCGVVNLASQRVPVCLAGCLGGVGAQVGSEVSGLFGNPSPKVARCLDLAALRAAEDLNRSRTIYYCSLPRGEVPLTLRCRWPRHPPRRSVSTGARHDRDARGLQNICPQAKLRCASSTRPLPPPIRHCGNQTH